MSFPFEQIVALALPFIGALIWLIRLEGRVKSHDRELADMKDTHEKAVAQIREDLRYIKNRIDTALDRQRLT